MFFQAIAHETDLCEEDSLVVRQLVDSIDDSGNILSPWFVESGDVIFSSSSAKNIVGSPLLVDALGNFSLANETKNNARNIENRIWYQSLKNVHYLDTFNVPGYHVCKVNISSNYINEKIDACYIDIEISSNLNSYLRASLNNELKTTDGVLKKQSTRSNSFRFEVDSFRAYFNRSSVEVEGNLIPENNYLSFFNRDYNIFINIRLGLYTSSDLNNNKNVKSGYYPKTDFRIKYSFNSAVYSMPSLNLSKSFSQEHSLTFNSSSNNDLLSSKQLDLTLACGAP